MGIDIPLGDDPVADSDFVFVVERDRPVVPRRGFDQLVWPTAARFRHEDCLPSARRLGDEGDMAIVIDGDEALEALDGEAIDGVAAFGDDLVVVEGAGGGGG